MNKKAQVVRVGLILLLFSGLDMANSAASENRALLKYGTVVLQLRWFHQFQFAGYYAAVEQGFYQEAGLHVILKQYTPDTLNTIDEVLSGRAAYGVTNSEVLLHRLHGEPLVVLAAIFQHSPLVFVTRQSSGISTPQDLIGRRIRMSITRNVEFTSMFVSEGIDLNRLQIQNDPVVFDDHFDASFDAVSAYLTNEPYFLKQAGIPFTVIKPVTYGIDFYGDCLFTTDTEVNTHPKRVKAFREATLRGWRYAMQHPEEIIDLLVKKYNPHKTREHLEYEANIMREFIMPELVEIGFMNPGRWQHIADTFVTLGFAEPDYTLAGFVYDPSRPSDDHWLRWIIGIMAGGILFAGSVTHVLLRFNRRLQQEIEVRKRTESDLLAEKDKAQQYLQLAGVMFVAFDPGGRVILVNKKTCDVLGWREHEIVGKNWFEYFLPQSYRKDVWAVFQQIMTGQLELVEYYENPVLTQAGTERLIAWHNAYLQAPTGDIVGILSSGEDISERKQAEREIRRLNADLEQRVQQRTAALEAVNNELKDFAYIVSHDLKAPLRGIAQLTHWLVQDYNEHFDAEGKEMTELLIGRVKRMDSLIDGILQYSRVSRIQSPTSMINLYELVTSVIDTLALPEHIRITIDTPFPTILGDTTRLSQLFQNLLSNAMKFMDKPQGIIRLACTDDDSFWTFSVADNGLGIEARDYDRIFQIFHSLHPEHEYQSTGVGLAVVKKIVEFYGGNIWVESVVGQGSTFYFTLPQTDSSGEKGEM